ncbi:nitrate reductase catalytic subunit NapA [Thioalkalivibrio paradoxus]|uniref:Periplasmic nitrate reductase n=1 Tax=Thioalkalivibrio paradoxus ARh 1 TaxID=713585 RepID=W0DIA6_9GAMM|nr:nitrate reductase catalytic subunit NapA [Thioalkalivibrio paradoxus]AHE98136.1 nitrate reductase catalytic subunit [Thioalkalivibrio paradoxus ARh 1]
MTVSRREFLKAGIAASTASMAGLSLGPAALAAAQQAEQAEQDWKWDKTVCRFCGTGCGLMLATKNGRVVAQKGDVENPVNRGWQCVKGYFNAKIMYGQDRLTQPLMRMKDGQFHKEGNFVPVSWEQAFDEMERQLRKTYAEKGPEGIACFGSGQWTVQEGYAMNKLFKAGFRANMVDPNARNCMASAVAAFYSTFGTDEPAGNYDDIEHTDTMILWGANMAEMHTVLWSRIMNRRMSNPNVRVVNLTTFRNMSSDGADMEIIFKPNTDLAILNYLAREVIARGAVNEDFVNKHCIFTTGPYDIGYGLRADPEGQWTFPAEADIVAKELKVALDQYEAVGQRRREGEVVEQNNRANPGAHWSISFEDYKKALEPYTLDFVAEFAKGDGAESLEDFKRKLKDLADLYVDQQRKVVSYWTMGVNQHTRGTWVNEQIYAVHLLLGKQSQPGNGAFSLTGQPSACGTAREVGTFAHRLPADRLIPVPAHREYTEKQWKIPAKTISPKVGSFYAKIMRDLQDGSVKWAWVQVNNPWHTHPNSNHWIAAARKADNFIIVSEAYPGISAKVADLILPVAMIFEKYGAYGNAERRTQHWREMVPPPGNAKGDLWQVLEFSKRFTIGDFWGEQTVPGLRAAGYDDDKLPSVLAEAGAMGYSPEDSLYKVLFATPDNMKYKWPDPIANGGGNHTSEALGDGWFVEKALWQEYVPFGRGIGKDLADYDVYHGVRGLRWPVVDGKEGSWRFNEQYDPYVTRGAGFEFYGKLQKAIPSGDLDQVTDTTAVPLPNKAKIFFRPYSAPVEQPDDNYDLWFCTGRVLEHWHSGTMTRRVPELHRAVPAAVLWMHPEDARERGLQRNDLVWLESRRGKVQIRVETGGRNTMPKGTVYAPFFDEGVFINKVCIDAACPISKESDYKKSAVKVYKA